MILTSYNEGLDINNLELEIGCYKRAENMGWDETAAACMPAILTLTETTQKGDQKGLMKSIQAKFKECHYFTKNQNQSNPRLRVR